MRHSHSTVFYSQGFYTAPFGYKMCLRCNININKGEEYLNIFIHLMPGTYLSMSLIRQAPTISCKSTKCKLPLGLQTVIAQTEIQFQRALMPNPRLCFSGDNDEFLDWPFQGKICITVLNQAKNRLHRENYSETIATRDPLRAYDQPAAASVRNVNGFGIHEFIRVNGLYSHGFVSERGNTLAIRATYEPLAGNEHSDH